MKYWENFAIFFRTFEQKKKSKLNSLTLSSIMIHPSAIITNSTIGDSASIGPWCFISDSIIWDNVRVEWSVRIEKSEIKNNTEILWWSIIRESIIESECIIWCEVKRSHIWVKARAKHLGTTLGSLRCGKNNNFWSGVKCANYDGKWKGNFVLWDDVFVWCNTVMSVKADTTRTIGNGVKIGALVHVDMDIPDKSLVYMDKKTGTLSIREGYYIL